MAKSTCAKLGCSAKARRNYHCWKHFREWWFESGCPSEYPKCSIRKCPEPAYLSGWCAMHYQRQQRTGDPLGLAGTAKAIEDLPEEVWLPVPEFAGYYDVSNLARLRSHLRQTATGERGGNLLEGYLRDDGYTQVILYGPGGKKKNALVHHLVALAFLGPRPAGMDIRHLDGDPGNSVLENLAYGTSSENMLDVKRHGRGWSAKNRCRNGHLYDEANTRWYNGTRFCRACDRDRSRERTVQAKHEDGPERRYFSAAELAAEIWAPILGYEGYYEGGSLGRIRALEALVSIGGRGPRLLDANPSRRDAYPAVSLLSPDGTRKRFTVHSLIAEAFLGPRPEGMEVRHLDGNSHNAALSNLAYGTPGDNQRDKLRHGTHHYAKRDRCKYGHEYTPENTRIDTHPDGSFKRRICLQCETDRRRGRQARVRKERAEQAA